MRRREVRFLEEMGKRRKANLGEDKTTLIET